MNLNSTQKIVLIEILKNAESDFIQDFDCFNPELKKKFLLKELEKFIDKLIIDGILKNIDNSKNLEA